MSKPLNEATHLFDPHCNCPPTKQDKVEWLEILRALFPDAEHGAMMRDFIGVWKGHDVSTCPRHGQGRCLLGCLGPNQPHGHGFIEKIPFTMEDVHHWQKERDLWSRLQEITRASEDDQVLPKVKKMLHEEKYAKFLPDLMVAFEAWLLHVLPKE